MTEFSSHQEIFSVSNFDITDQVKLTKISYIKT
jgi:hypothetical protein